MKNTQIINKRYDKAIRLTVATIACALLMPVAYSYKGGIRDITFKHFDQELGYACSYIRNMGVADFKCSKITPISSHPLNPVSKKWVYTIDEGKKVEVIREVKGQTMTIELIHPNVFEKTIKTITLKNEV